MDQRLRLILHQPLPSEFERTVAAYKALEKLLADGNARAIGVSNFLPEYLDSLLAQVDVVPAVNQIELHPYFTLAASARAATEAAAPARMAHGQSSATT